LHKIRYYGLWHSSKKALLVAARVLLIFRKPTEKEVPLLTGEVAPCERLEAKRYGECCPKCSSERVRLIGKSERVAIPHEEVQRGRFGWLMTLTRGDP